MSAKALDARRVEREMSIRNSFVDLANEKNVRREMNLHISCLLIWEIGVACIAGPLGSRLMSKLRDISRSSSERPWRECSVVDPFAKISCTVSIC